MKPRAMHLHKVNGSLLAGRQLDRGDVIEEGDLWESPMGWVRDESVGFILGGGSGCRRVRPEKGANRC